MDILGQKIFIDRVEKHKGIYTYKLNLLDFAQGVYVLELISENKIYNKLVIKK